MGRVENRSTEKDVVAARGDESETQRRPTTFETPSTLKCSRPRTQASMAFSDTRDGEDWAQKAAVPRHTDPLPKLAHRFPSLFVRHTSNQIKL